MKRLLRSAASSAATYGLMAVGVVGYFLIRAVIEIKDQQLRESMKEQQRRRGAW